MYTIFYLHRQIIVFLVVLCFLLLSVPCNAVDVAIHISGVEGDIRRNILASMRLNALKKKADLSMKEINRLSRKASKEAEHAMRPYGYYDAKVEGKLEEIESGMLATYHVIPGDPVRITAIKLFLSTEEQLPGLDDVFVGFPLVIGNILDQQKYESGKKGILHRARQEGYLDCEFSISTIKIHRQDKVAEIELELQPGERYYFGETSSEQDIIISKLLQKYLGYEVGDPYSLKDIGELQRSLYRAGFFQYVTVRGDKEKAVDLHVPILVEVEPLNYLNRYSFGVGFATDTGIHGKVGWENKLFNRRGHRVRSSLQLAERQSEFALYYEIPILDPRYYKHVLGASYNEETWEDTETKLLALGATLNYDGDFYNFGFATEARDEVYNVGVTDGSAFVLMPSINFGVIVADDLAKTGWGFHLGSDLKGGSESFFSDVSFLQGKIRGKGILSPIPKWRIILRGEIGATWVDDINDLPPSLRFYTGGDQTVRGYKYKEIGATDESGTVVGGRYLLLGSVECEREISSLWSVAVFYDEGNAMNDWDEDLKQGVGGGVRIRLPFGQIRVDLASAISEPDNPFRLHLTVGGDL